MPILSTSQFTGPLTIPGIAERGTAQAILQFIELHEPIFLREALGQALYDELIAGLTLPGPPQEWRDLRDGVTYTWQGRSYRYEGLKNALAAYVYYHWCDNKGGSQLTTSGGMATNADGTPSTPLNRDMERAWNTLMRPALHSLYLYLTHNRALYPSWVEPSGGWWRSFNPINSFGL